MVQQSLTDIIKDLFNDGMEIEAESFGTSQAMYGLRTVWMFTIQYGGRQDSFEITLNGADTHIPEAPIPFENLFSSDLQYSEDGFTEWSIDYGMDQSIIDKIRTLKEVWEEWLEIVSLKKRLRELFGNDLFQKLLWAVCYPKEEK